VAQAELREDEACRADIVVNGLTGDDSYAPEEAAVAGKTPVKLLEMPQSVSVVTRKQTEDRSNFLLTLRASYWDHHPVTLDAIFGVCGGNPALCGAAGRRTGTRRFRSRSQPGDRTEVPLGRRSRACRCDKFGCAKP
jgi:hypothetical protein